MLGGVDGIVDGARGLVGRALDLALPARCVGCGLEGSPLCDRCRPALDARLRDAPGWPIGMPVDLPAPVVQLEWCAPYAGTVRRAVHHLKYGGERRLARPLGEAVARRWRRAGAGGDLLVPVPVHGDRLRERGYDQAVLIGEAAGLAAGLPTHRVLVRSRSTRRQFDLDRDARSSNVDGAFRLSSGGRELVADRWVVLVDDVVTTGSTLAACAAALMDGGALAVSAIVVARER
jgi:ComF family protein